MVMSLLCQVVKVVPQEDELWANELGFGYKGLKHAIADYEEIFGGEHV